MPIEIRNGLVAVLCARLPVVPHPASLSGILDAWQSSTACRCAPASYSSINSAPFIAHEEQPRVIIMAESLQFFMLLSRCDKSVRLSPARTNKYVLA